MMSCIRCGKPTSREVSDNVLSVICISGHRVNFYRKPDGTWENETERRKRMAVTVTCDECKKDYDLPCQTAESRKVCPACTNRKHAAIFSFLSEKRRAAQAKATKRSSWGIFRMWGKR
jgi:hypothetical protein